MPEETRGSRAPHTTWQRSWSFSCVGSMGGLYSFILFFFFLLFFLSFLLIFCLLLFLFFLLLLFLLCFFPFLLILLLLYNKASLGDTGLSRTLGFREGSIFGKWWFPRLQVPILKFFFIFYITSQRGPFSLTGFHFTACLLLKRTTLYARMEERCDIPEHFRHRRNYLGVQEHFSFHAVSLALLIGS